MKTRRSEIKTVRAVHSTKGWRYTIHYVDGGLDREVKEKYIERFFTRNARKYIYSNRKDN